MSDRSTYFINLDNRNKIRNDKYIKRREPKRKHINDIPTHNKRNRTDNPCRLQPGPGIQTTDAI